jgi:hypothetical protein
MATGKRILTRDLATPKNHDKQWKMSGSLYIVFII